jgi:hypothetical protein
LVTERAVGPSLSLSDANGKTRAMFGLLADGPMLSLSGADQKAEALVTVMEEGPKLRVVDTKKNVIWSAP